MLLGRRCAPPRPTARGGPPRTYLPRGLPAFTRDSNGSFPAEDRDAIGFPDEWEAGVGTDNDLVPGGRKLPFWVDDEAKAAGADWDAELDAEASVTVEGDLVTGRVAPKTHFYLAVVSSVGGTTMALGTRGVLAVLAGLLMTAALFAARSENRLLGTWIMMLGFVVATLWSVLSVVWAQSNPSVLAPDLWIAMASMAAAATVYFGYLGLHGEGLGE